MTLRATPRTTRWFTGDLPLNHGGFPVARFPVADFAKQPFNSF
jgi:hypothetical protein